MEPKKDLILHIGRAKSGTSTLQRYLTAQRSKLAEEGVCYPVSGTGGRFAHHTLAQACRRGRPFNTRIKDLRAQFETEIAPFRTVIVSSEAFQNLLFTHNLSFLFGGTDAGALKSFAHWALPSLRKRPYHIRVICYIREYLELASSSYAQRVHATDYVDTFDGYCRKHFRRPLMDLVRMWRSFADEAQFLYYQRNHLKDRDIVADFFAQIGLSQPTPSNSSDANPSISGNLLAFKLLLNHRGYSTASLYNALTRIARLEPQYRGKIFVSDEDAQRMRRQDRGYNTQLSQLVGQIDFASFEGGNRFEPESWARDMERFVEHPGLETLKERPDIYRTNATEMTKLLER